MAKSATDLSANIESKPLRGRPRSEHSHEAILDAVLELLEDEGYGALTIEGVARHVTS